jgi:F0F1-type ATP synthase assembly protein I
MLAQRVSAVGMEFGLPPLVGALADRRFGTTGLFTILGCLVGFTVGMWHVLRIAREGTGG